MNRIGLGVLCVGIAGGVCAAQVPSTATQGPRPAAFRPLVIVPGGYTRQAPANTARPLEMAIEDGLDVVELPVRRTRDGRHVIFDAEALDYRTSGKGMLRGISWDELQTLDAGRWLAPRLAGTKVLSLAECLDLAKGRIKLILACHDVEPVAFVGELAAAEMLGDVFVDADAAQVPAMQKSADGRVRALVDLPPDTDIATWIAAIPPESAPAMVRVNSSQATAENCRNLHDAQIGVMADTVDSRDVPQAWDKLLTSGVDAIRTDVPEEFVIHAIAQRFKNRSVQVAAHRGALRYAPENTRPALSKATRMRNDFVEIDVHTTKDGGLFLLHDATLDRTTTGNGRVRESSTQTVRELDAGAWFGRTFARTPVPELNGYLAQFPPTMGLYFDAKDISPEALVAAVTEHGLVQRTVVYQGPVYLEKLKQLNPHIRLLAPIAAASHVDTLAKRLQPYAVDTPWRLLSREFIEHCHSVGIKVFADAKRETTIEQYRLAMEWGIDLIQTDYPLRFWQALEQRAESTSTKPLTEQPAQ